MAFDDAFRFKPASLPPVISYPPDANISRKSPVNRDDADALQPTRLQSGTGCMEPELRKRQVAGLPCWWRLERGTEGLPGQPQTVLPQMLIAGFAIAIHIDLAADDHGLRDAVVFVIIHIDEPRIAFPATHTERRYSFCVFDTPDYALRGRSNGVLLRVDPIDRNRP